MNFKTTLYTMFAILAASFAGIAACSYFIHTIVWENLARTEFRNALKQEISKRDSISVGSWTQEDSDEAIPQDRAITRTYWDESGEHQLHLSVPMLQNALTTSKSMLIKQTVRLEKAPLDADTVAVEWKRLLQQKHCPAEVETRIMVTGTNGKISTSHSRGRHASVDSLLTCYVGDRWEVMATGYWHYRWHDAVSWWWAAGIALLFGAAFYNHEKQKIRELATAGSQPEEIPAAETVVNTTIEPTTVAETQAAEPPQAHQRHANLSRMPVYDFGGGIRFLSEQHAITDGNLSSTLSPQECLALLELIKAEQHTLSIDELMDKIWGKKVKRHLVHAVINRLRKKLEPFPVIKIIKEREGYKLLLSNLDIAKQK